MDRSSWTPELLVAAYQKEGIRSVEDLAGKLLSAWDKAETSIQRSSFLPLRRAPNKEQEAAIVHRVPQIPFSLNGTLYDPADIRRFDGQELHFFLTLSDHPSEIAALDSRHDLAILVQASVIGKISRTTFDLSIQKADNGSQSGSDTHFAIEIPNANPGGPESIGTKWLPPTSTVACMYSGHHWGGYKLELKVHRAYSDLTDQYIFWPFDNWNDEITSLAPCTSVCGYSDHVNYGGNSLILTSNNGIADLTPYGWDNRISSVQNWG